VPPPLPVREPMHTPDEGKDLDGGKGSALHRMTGRKAAAITVGLLFSYWVVELALLQRGGLAGELLAFESHLLWGRALVTGLMAAFGVTVGSVLARRARAEEELRRKSDFVNTILSSLAYPFFVLDATTHAVRLSNPAADRSNLPDSFPCLAAACEDGAACRGERACAVEEVKKTRTSLSLEFVRADAADWPRIYEVHCHPVFDGDREVAQVIVSFLDITARKRAEAMLLGEKARLEAAQEELLRKNEESSRLFRLVEVAKTEWERTMDCIGSMVVLSDTGGRIRRCNRAFQHFVGGQPFQAIIGRDSEAMLRESGLEVSLASEGAVEIFHEPSKRWFLIRNYPFRATAGGGREHGGTVTTIRDFTELKEVTKELILRNAELHDAYTELQNTQAQMLQQEKMASIGQLAAGVAHEINNPISFVSSNLGTLGRYVGRLKEYIRSADEVIASAAPVREREDMEGRKKALKVDCICDDLDQLVRESQEGTDRVRKIVQDLKIFSRTGAAEMVPTDVNECLRSTITIVWNELKYKAVLEKEFGDIPPARGYPQQLNQVFLNLLVNAMDAIEKEGKVAVRTWSENRSVFASVSDTGCGIRTEHLGRIFEPFFTTKEVGKGTGLGLSITYDIVKKHNGDITVRSKEGVGTTFIVRIPAAEG
jgi:signal transduction histidine kinase